MPTRSQMRIRRDINRLSGIADQHADRHPALEAIRQTVASTAHMVNTCWQEYQAAVVAADRERQERDVAVDRVRSWVQRWRPVVLLSVPGAQPNLRALPPAGSTQDDMIRVAEDLMTFIAGNPGAEAFREAALGDLEEGIEAARRELVEARAARPVELGARSAFSEATISANTVLVRGTEVVRAIFGPRSFEYKQFITRGSAEEEEADAVESMTGEGEDA